MALSFLDPTNDNEEEEEEDSTNDWKLRDAAQSLLQDRQALQSWAQQSSQQQSQLLSSRTFDTHLLPSKLNHHGRHHEVNLTLVFDLAAATVLQAIQDQSAQQDTNSTASIDTTQLPWQVVQHRRLLMQTTESLQRSHNNKKFAKRKSTTPPAAATTTTTTTTKKNPRTKETTQVTTNTTATTSSSTAPTTTTTTLETTTTTAPKFTRNTPASSAAALDLRFTSSRAILCAAGNLAFGALTPGNGTDALDVLNVPQNNNNNSNNNNNNNETSSKDDEPDDAQPKDDEPKDTDKNNKTTPCVNMGAVVVEAQTLGQRTIQVVHNAMRRANLRYQYRKDNTRWAFYTVHNENDQHFLQLPNPWDWQNRQQQQQPDPSNKNKNQLKSIDNDHSRSTTTMTVPYHPNEDSWMSYHWQSHCLPRLDRILHRGAGHAIYHDLEWCTRHGRVAHLLQTLAQKHDNYGPHLIITTQPQVPRFAQEFHDAQVYVNWVETNNSNSNNKENTTLRVLPYTGSPTRRRHLRTRYFPQATGWPEAPFHVLVMSYTTFLQDYLHISQLPLDCAVLDESMGWMAAAQGDSNSSIRSIWDTALFSSNDQHMGLAGTPSFREWDYSDDAPSEAVVKQARVGLTARHRILTARTFRTQQRTHQEVVSVQGLVRFVAPHFADVVREEWDRSRIASDVGSMNHFRKLVARSTIVHGPDAGVDDMDQLAVQALAGKLGTYSESTGSTEDPQVPRIVPDEEFVSSGKVASSRRWTLGWLGPPETSWLRYELGSFKFEPILDAMKLSHNHGHFCEEITTASSTTSSGASGQVAGTMAYRLALCCGRHFGSEQGLRQHVSALHAPPGTWLCRTCSMDCVTSQARTHHERSCGQPTGGAGEGDTAGSGGATPIVGQGGGPKSGVGKKKGGRSSSAQQGTLAEEKDPDGSFRVPGFRGVWINTAGKHFVKIDGQRWKKNGEEVLFFDSVDDAARKYDELTKKNKKKNQKVELNFKPNGTRIVYEDITPASTSGLGGSAASVVPALSVINIKDLPPDVKPLLRDPRQTSRTGGNSKRHVYAYRGVCRQARKGHDRWQSQISFMGQNHYLGTFDSEWDAAAVYSWAHLILYGEEATRQAQKEGEAAAAAYEQEKKDIAAGKIPEPPPKPEKKKKTPVKKSADGDGDKPASGRKRKAKADTGSAKKPKPAGDKKGKVLMTSVSARHKEAITPILTKGVSKAPILSRREMFEKVDDDELVSLVAQKMKFAREVSYSSMKNVLPPASNELRRCLPVTSVTKTRCLGTALLVGISPTAVGWDLQGFVEANRLSETEMMAALQLLAVEYDEDGVNEKFMSVIQGSVCVIGCADKKTQQAYQALGMGTVPVGGTVGKLDCHIGGVPGSCSEMSACIRYSPCAVSDYKIACLAYDDCVTVNGERLTRAEGNIALQSGDIVSVGARVFSFVTAAP